MTSQHIVEPVTLRIALMAGIFQRNLILSRVRQLAAVRLVRMKRCLPARRVGNQARRAEMIEVEMPLALARIRGEETAGAIDVVGVDFPVVADLYLEDTQHFTVKIADRPAILARLGGDF